MLNLDLHPAHLSLLITLLNKHAPDVEIWAYGSRVAGTAHEGSDLDLVLRNSQELDVPQKNLYKLRDALSESNLPMSVEVLDWARLPEEFCRDIERQHVVVATPARSGAK